MSTGFMNEIKKTLKKTGNLAVYIIQDESFSKVEVQASYFSQLAVWAILI